MFQNLATISNTSFYCHLCMRWPKYWSFSFSIPKCKLLCLSCFGNCFDSWVRDEGTDTCTEVLESAMRSAIALSKHQHIPPVTFSLISSSSQTCSSLSFSSLHYSWNIYFHSFCLLKCSQSSAQYPTYSRCSINIYWAKKYSWLMLLIIARDAIKYWKGELDLP